MNEEQKENESQKSNKNLFSDMEKEILSYWEKYQVFERTLQKTKKGKEFVFYEGPPYANGRPGLHHVLARSFKDIVLRFKTMQGYFVPRKAGWDTHGLPAEMEVEKKLNVHTKKEIETLGVETFVETARENVFVYKHEWEKMTRRMGYWLDLEHPYVTMANDYIEALWWVFSQIAKNGYLYKDYKVLPWCPRCETSLSSHEVAQGYQKVQDESVYVKFPILNFSAFAKARAGKKFSNKIINYKLPVTSYFLVWTTTPWTLPGNVALAVNPKATYVVAEKGGERLILAQARLSVLGEGWKVIKKQKGKDLVGLSYEPLYLPSYKLQVLHFKVVAADFVTTEDGTGIVHIAPAFGADDQKVGKKNNLPTLVTVREDGTMVTEGKWSGKLFSDANPMIIAELQGRSILFKKETYEHEYPFCWRCKSKLMYYAKDSWFLKTTAVKQRMIAENKKVVWLPDFVGKNRFGEWLRENVDWAISRERYWGMPLPIWECRSCGHTLVVGSLDELDTHAPRDKTDVYVMRHGEASHNLQGIVGPTIHKYDKSALTERGKKQVHDAARALQKADIAIIVTSPMRRAQETARIISKMWGGTPVEVRPDLADINVGAWHGKKEAEVDKLLPPEKRFENAFPQGESSRDTRVRVMNAIRKIRETHNGKHILVISHGDPLWLLNAAQEGVPEEECRDMWYPDTGEVKHLIVHNWPYSTKRGELDFHRPYIDEIALLCSKCKKGEMRRVKDVADVWFDSGAMPFAQNFQFFAKIKNKKVNIKNIGSIIPYPSDYICEGMDQTRGWFYTLLAVSSLLELPVPYKNVITIGLVLDAKGEKMSKSKGNFPEPIPLFETYGADAVRWYFYTINHPWDEKLFNERDIKDASRRFLMIFWNIFQFWQGYSSIFKKIQTSKSKILINKWLLSRLDEAVADVTNALNEYDVVRAARLIEYFITEDISRWYVRRIRHTMKLGTGAEQKETYSILAYILSESAKITAPFIPFLSEKIYQGAGGKESVHLAGWPTANQKSKIKNQKLLQDMQRVREIVANALQLRSDAKIKVRQPLASLKIKDKKSNIKNNRELIELIKGEVNVKKIDFGAKIKQELELDIVITEELKKEGIFRDLIRHIQQLRKDAGFTQQQLVVIHITTNKEGQDIVKMFESQLKKEVNAKQIIIGDTTHSLFMKSSINIENYYFEIGFKK